MFTVKVSEVSSARPLLPAIQGGAPVSHSVRDLRRMLALSAAAVSLAAAGVAAIAVQPALASATGGSGASLPYTEVQAESSATTGTVIGPSYTQGQLADEAS